MATHQATSLVTARSMTLGAVFAGALLAGCASGDRTGAAASIAAANAALTAAATADANRYASGELQSARRSLGEAGAAMNEREYERAGLLALEAETDAQLALARANSSKAQVAATELNESTRLLRDELGRARQ